MKPVAASLTGTPRLLTRLHCLLGALRAQVSTIFSKRLRSGVRNFNNNGSWALVPLWRHISTRNARISHPSALPIHERENTAKEKLMRRQIQLGRVSVAGQ